VQQKIDALFTFSGSRSAFRPPRCRRSTRSPAGAVRGPAPVPPQNAVRRAIIDNFPVRGRLPFAHVGADFRPSLHCKIELQRAARARSGKPGLAAVVGHLETKYESPPTHLDSKLGFDVAEATVSRFMPRHRKPPSQTGGWASQQIVLRTRDRIHPPGVSQTRRRPRRATSSSLIIAATTRRHTSCGPTFWVRFPGR